MASGQLLGGDGAGSNESCEKPLWEDNKVYCRKSHNKAAGRRFTSNSLPRAVANDVSSSQHHSSLQRRRSPPAPLPASSAASDDDASSLNRPPQTLINRNHSNRHHDHLQNFIFNGQFRSVNISLTSRSREEIRELRLKLAAELELVRAMTRRIEAQELAASASLVPPAGYTLSQLSVSDPITTILDRKTTEVASAGPRRPQAGVSGMPGEGNLNEGEEKEKWAPKVNLHHRKSDFRLGMEKHPPPEPHGFAKHKVNGSNENLMAEKDSVIYAQAFKSCKDLLSKLMKHKHGWVFNAPVDAKKLNIPDYYSIIKHPMDLGTIKSRLNKNWYKSPEEFAEDVRLTFNNAMTYNPKGQDVHHMAEQLLNVFEEKWVDIEALYSFTPYPSSTMKKVAPDLRTLERSDSTVHPASVDSKHRMVHPVPNIGRPPPLKKPKAKDPDKRDMTFEEKQRLSNNLQNLPPEKLENIVQIIKKRNSSLNQHDDEIEVDIDSVDVETLWELDRFVTNYKKSLSKNRRKEKLAILARAGVEGDASQRVLEEHQIPGPVVAEENREDRTVVDDKGASSSSQIREEHEGENPHRSSRSSSSSSDSGSSSSDSDNESSSAGSDGSQSPRT
ncbi:hypothetical protein HPP92_002843 [Vanilla planifolia]|uniref:Transcription factor GTE4 n=1 Tax=Vanilla planifolia TaxID=51239 RepID=A0A835S739_VANPL|nr:hypothetical protein HPP92_002843 [Vanilla planifolia]